MDPWLQKTIALATAPPPEARRAVGQLSGVLLVVALVGLVAVCGLILVALRRRARENDARRTPRRPDPGDAWAEASRRVPLEEGDDIPREPGTA